MVIIRFIGGLGNQLFIYAFGRALEINYNMDVRFDTYSGFQKDTYKRKFELDNFNIKIKKTSKYNSVYFPIRKRSEVITKILYPGSLYIEEDKNFSVTQFKEQTNLYNNIFMQGYFQEPEYFESIKEELKKELTLNKELFETVNNYLKAINKSNSVAVHIRLKEISNQNQLGFYSENIAKLRKELNQPIFFIFSDDIRWCKENIQLDSDVLFIENTNNQIEDFWLMKNCKHFIISNSTFSWWASWLSSFDEKIIIKPMEMDL